MASGPGLILVLTQQRNVSCSRCHRMHTPVILIFQSWIIYRLRFFASLLGNTYSKVQFLPLCHHYQFEWRLVASRIFWNRIQGCRSPTWVLGLSRHSLLFVAWVFFIHDLRLLMAWWWYPYDVLKDKRKHFQSLYPTSMRLDWNWIADILEWSSKHLTRTKHLMVSRNLQQVLYEATFVWWAMLAWKKYPYVRYNTIRSSAVFVLHATRSAEVAGVKKRWFVAWRAQACSGGFGTYWFWKKLGENN